MESIIKYIVTDKDLGYKDTYLDKLLNVINESRKGTQYPVYTYARLNKELKKLGKSKKNWDRNIFIGSVLDAKNPAKFYFWKLKELKCKK